MRKSHRIKVWHRQLARNERFEERERNKLIEVQSTEYWFDLNSLEPVEGSLVKALLLKAYKVG